MKLTQTSQNVTNLKVFKPIQYLHIVKTGGAGSGSAMKLRARIVNSESGRVDEIIPCMEIGVLSEICTMNEGFYVNNNQDAKFKGNIMLHPTSAVYLSNDKYLEIDLEGMPQDGSWDVTIYGIESDVIDKDFVCRYNKFYMSAGELQKTFAVGTNENLIIPTDSFSEVVLQYKNGSSCTYTTEELQGLMLLKNDIVCLPGTYLRQDGETGERWMIFGFQNMYGLDISEVDNFTIRRDKALAAFELVMIDTMKD